MKKEKFCETCEYPGEFFEGKAICKRYPPVTIPTPGTFGGWQYKHPVIWKTNWCGEWKEKW